MFLYEKYIILLLLIASLISCGLSERKARNVVDMHKYNPELSKIYNHYKVGKYKDKGKHHAVCFLLSNLENNYSDYGRNSNIVFDSEIINADSLFLSIEHSLVVWNNSRWKENYSKEQFMEYVLPYRIANEPLEYFWKKNAYISYHNLIAGAKSIEEAAKIINENIQLKIDPQFYNVPVKGYTGIIQTKAGKCDDRAILVSMVARSLGIPAAFDIIPYRGSVNNGHSVASIILPNDSVLVLNSHDTPVNTYQIHRTPKVYRQMYSVQKGTILYANKDTEEIPLFFSNQNLLDVTDKHNLGAKDYKMALSPGKTYNKLVYMSVFSPQSWIPVAYAENRGYSTIFSNLGTGSDKNGVYPPYYENSGSGIVYLPSAYKEGQCVPLAYPIIHGNHCTRTLQPNPANRQTIYIHRKYPKSKWIVEYSKQMTWGRFEVSDKPDFTDKNLLYLISEKPFSRPQSFLIDCEGEYKYIRYYMPEKGFSIAEFAVYDRNGQQIIGSIITCKELADAEDLNNIFDGNPLTYYTNGVMRGLWVGLEFPYPITIGRVEFCPRNDENDIFPGDTYELFYWDNQWISLGQQIATDYQLVYKNVPSNALLWIRNLTKGVEERPFTYDNEKQIWW